ncbi:MAG: cupin domain-containing protein [Deltaproteobacteria bacterium]|nr:cupin domain-containing protein [Deltaproteobacteria bacterium]
MEVIDLMEKAIFSDQFAPQILRMTPQCKVPLICMEPGQLIPPHPSGTGVFYIVSGKGVMTIEGKELEVQAGNMIFIEQGESRGIRATETMMAFAVHIN